MALPVAADMTVEYRLVEICAPERAGFVLQWRLNFTSGWWRPRVKSTEWVTLPTIPHRALPAAELAELRTRLMLIE
ncbi:MAG TPA: hypothetical protein VFA39_18945 [Steroidobacteraceae bacterium]|nr:hypothetical protein [Steroidobacteraceae bacterium]